MCTLIVAWRAFEDAPVVVAANRDELLDRPARPPAVVRENPRVVAPLDEEAGGTWIGHNEHGVVAAVTNRWVDADLAGERSRGLLVADALGYASAAEAGGYVERTVEAFEYQGFNLVVLDAETARLYEWDRTLHTASLAPGVHVVVNVGADDHFDIPREGSEDARKQAESAQRARAELAPEPSEDASAWLERAVPLLCDHEYGFCVHGDGYGTRSSSLITVHADGNVTESFADGPPCETPHQRVESGI